MNNRSEQRITLGTIVAPHGVRGDLRLRPDIERPEVLKKLRQIYIGDTLYTLCAAHPHKNVYILHVEGIGDRNGAEAVVGRPASVPVSQIPPLPRGEYYYFQLMGLMVTEEDGREVGPIREIIQTGANDVYVAALPGGKELCIPAIPPVILSVDPAAGRMTVRLPEWED